MKNISALVREYILPNFNDFKYHKNMIFRVPVGDILSGFYFEKIKNYTYVWIFFMPLFIPNKNIVFTFGQRLRNSSGKSMFHLDELNIHNTIENIIKVMNENLPLVYELIDTRKFYEYFSKKDTNFNIHQDLVFTSCYLNQPDCNMDLLNLIHLIEKSDSKNLDWMQELLTRAKKLLQIDKEQRSVVFSNWRLETINEIGINKVCL
jgi:hypothetical protein